MIWLPLVAWAAFTLLAHRLMPAAPTHRFELADAMLALDGKEPSHAQVAAVYSDGNTIVTTQGERRQNVRFWDVQRRELIGELETTGLNAFRHDALSKNDAWLGFVNRHDQVPWIEYFETSSRTRVHTIPSREAVYSSRGDRVAYWDDAIRVLDLNKGTSRILTDVHVSPRCFSSDDRLLACVSDKFILVIDASTGASVATFAIAAADGPDYVYGIEFGPDNASIAWQVGHSVVVTDLAAKNRCVIENAHLIGWASSGRVLTADRNYYHHPVRYMEMWDWRENRRVARWDVPAELEFVVAYMKQWAAPPEIYIDRSRDGRHVLFAGYVQDRTPAPWLVKLREWLRLPSERELRLEVFVLDGDTLSLRDHWHIPAEQHRDVILQFTADSQHVVFTDGHVVEHWPTSSRSWLGSALWGGGGALLLVAIMAGWRFLRKRKRRAISAPDAPKK